MKDTECALCKRAESDKIHGDPIEAGRAFHPFQRAEATEAEPKGCAPHQLINCSECRKDALIKSQRDEIERLRGAMREAVAIIEGPGDIYIRGTKARDALRKALASG